MQQEEQEVIRGKNGKEWEEKDNTILVYEDGYDNPICVVRTKDAIIFNLIMHRFSVDKKKREENGERDSCVEVTVTELKHFIDNRSNVKGFEYMMWNITGEEKV
jgi:hypothetical protein